MINKELVDHNATFGDEATFVFQIDITTLDKKKEMLEYIREQDLWLYHKLRYSILGRAANLPGRGGRKMFVAAYKVCQKFYGFN